MTATPEFLCWAIEKSCPLRNCNDWQLPERTERELRSLRAASDALHTGRVFEGVALQGHTAADKELPLGFPVEEVLSAYGGSAAITSACGNCLANAVPADNKNRWAGCFGMLDLGIEPADAHQECEQAIDQLNRRQELKELFLATSPSWYGLWERSPLLPRQIAFLAELIVEMSKHSARKHPGLNQLSSALLAGHRSQLPMHVQLTPVGRVENDRWIMPVHCPECRAALQTFTRQHCPTCGRQGFPQPEKKRHLRGQRPYIPLSRFLSPAQVKQVVREWGN